MSERRIATFTDLQEVMHHLREEEQREFDLGGMTVRDYVAQKMPIIDAGRAMALYHNGHPYCVGGIEIEVTKDKDTIGGCWIWCTSEVKGKGATLYRVCNELIFNALMTHRFEYLYSITAQFHKESARLLEKLSFVNQGQIHMIDGERLNMWTRSVNDLRKTRMI